jgi:ribosome-associated protein
MAHAIIDLMTGVMASDILLLDIAEVTTIADYFIIATGETERQRRAIVDQVTEQMRAEFALRPLSVEGGDSGWTLLDYGAVVVHLFSPEQRGFYRLEQLWSAAKTVVRIA